jgi:hypothetical protein
MSCYSVGQPAYWWGRAFLGNGGGTYAVICDLRTPNSGTNTVDVVGNIWDNGGVNAIKKTIQNAVYGGDFVIKVSG